MDTSPINKVKTPQNAEVALIRNGCFFRDLLDERLDLDRLGRYDDLGVLELDGHPIDVPGRVHELR